MNGSLCYFIYEQIFTALLKPKEVSPLKWPGKLTFHTATCLVNPDEVGNEIWTGGPRLTQKVLILWGKDDEEHITSDMWILEIDGENIEDFTIKCMFVNICLYN